MDRLTTGRRRLRAGSVSVNELLVKQASPAPCSESSPAAREDVTAPQDVVPASHRRGETKGAHLAKLASIGVATAVLCGAVAIASMIGQHRRDEAQQPSRPAVRITGGQALLPDQLDPASPAKETRATVATPAVPTTEPTTEPVTEPQATRQLPATPASTSATAGTTASATAGASEPAIGAPTDLDLVREFYENLPASPVAAFGLLSPDLLHTSLSDFLQSWSLVRAIDDVHLVQQPDGVLATVRLRLADGGHLRLQQLLKVAESPRRIVGVQLLSAQRN